MKISIITKFAVRTLGRNIRRTILSAVGISIGITISLFLTSFMRGANDYRVKAIAESGFGHIRVAPKGWLTQQDNDMRLSDWESDLRAIRSLKEVSVAAPHARANALLAFGTRVTGVEILGVDPEAERTVNRITRAVSEGRYLNESDDDGTVIGSAIAERLDVELGDELLLTLVGKDGEMKYAMLSIVGIAHTGSQELDAAICHVRLEDIEELSGYPGAGEITVTVTDGRNLDTMVATIKKATPSNDDILTWREIQPAQGADYESDKAFMNLISSIVMIVVILGITSAQLTTILERKREFAVLIALGMKGVQVLRLIITEAVVLGIIGAIFGLILATPLVFYISTTGFDFSKMMGETSISGVLLDPVMYGDMGMWLIPRALLIGLISTFIAALYPAWFAIKTDPTSALSLREA